VALGPLPGLRRVARAPTADRALVLARGLELDLALNGVVIGGGAVGEVHLVLAVGVPEEIEDPFLFHQPRDEIEIRLAVLDAISADRRLAPDAHQVERRSGGAAQHRLDDLLGALVLEYPRGR